MNVEGSALYVRQQLAERLVREQHLMNDPGWLQLYALSIIASELETIRRLLEKAPGAPRDV